MAQMIEITDFDAPELDVYARLTENQLINRHEPEKGMFIAESPKVIERALDAGYMPVSILTEKRHIEGEGQKILARCGEIPVYTAEFDVKCGKSDKRGRYFPLCCGAWNGCGAADHRVQQSALPESNPCEYGDGVSGAVDISWRGDKAGDCEKSGFGRRERAGNGDRTKFGAGRESRLRELAEAAS